MGGVDLPLIGIVGPTASGKTAVAIEIAKRVNGEIICADSRTIYRGMDIGTAKPDAIERQTAIHWGLDLVCPDERYSVAQFHVYAKEKIADIRKRGHIPIIVGGSGLYVDAVLFDYTFTASDAEQGGKTEFGAMTNDALIEYCVKNNIDLPKDVQNRRRLIRSIMRGSNRHKDREKIIPSAIVVGIATTKHDLSERIAKRAQTIFAAGAIEEATELAGRYGWNHESMTGNIYELVRRFLDGEFNETELVQRFIQADKRLAKKQMTWFRRNPFIEWCEREQLVGYVLSRLDTEHEI